MYDPGPTVPLKRARSWRSCGSYFHTLRDPNWYRAIQGVVHARSMLEAGVANVRDVGNDGNYA